MRFHFGCHFFSNLPNKEIICATRVTSPTNPIWASDDTIIDHDSEYTQLKVIRLIAGMDGSELKSLPTSTAYINYGSNICS
jgi:hypothetical protein